MKFNFGVSCWWLIPQTSLSCLIKKYVALFALWRDLLFPISEHEHESKTIFSSTHCLVFNVFFLARYRITFLRFSSLLHRIWFFPFSLEFVGGLMLPEKRIHIHRHSPSRSISSFFSFGTFKFRKSATCLHFHNPDIFTISLLNTCFFENRLEDFFGRAVFSILSASQISNRTNRPTFSLINNSLTLSLLKEITELLTKFN